MTKLTPTLTQSGLLAVLLQRQRCKVIELARRRAHRKQLQAAFGRAFRRPFRVITGWTHVGGSGKPLVGTIPRHT